MKKYFLLPVLLLLLSGQAWAQDFLVPNQFPTIQAAIDAAPILVSRRIIVTEGVYTETLNVPAQKRIELRGPNAEISSVTATQGPVATIRPGTRGNVAITVSANATLIVAGFRIEADNAAAIFHDGNTANLTLRNNVIAGIHSGNSGVINVSGGGNTVFIAEGNRIENVSGVAVSGFQLRRCRDIVMRGNVVQGLSQSALLMQSPAGTNVIEQNFFQGLNSSAIEISAEATDPISGTTAIRFNELHNNNAAGEGDAGAITIAVRGGAGTLTIQNNTLLNSRNGLAVRNNITLPVAFRIDANYNLFIRNSFAAIYHGGTGLLYATGNWYGSRQGPIDNNNPGGTLQNINERTGSDAQVLYNPWIDGTNTPDNLVFAANNLATYGFQNSAQVTYVTKVLTATSLEPNFPAFPIKGYINEAIRLAKQGDKFYLFDGRYEESVELTNIKLGNNIIFESDGGTTVPIIRDLTMNGVGMSLNLVASDFSISGALTFNNGLIVPGSNTLHGLLSATINSGSVNSYVRGKFSRETTSTSDIDLLFPIGSVTGYRPATLSLRLATGSLSRFIGEVIEPNTIAHPIPAGVISFSPVRAHRFTREGITPFSNGRIGIQYLGDDWGVLAPADMRILKDGDGSAPWTNIGPSIGGPNPGFGTITSSLPFNTLGNFVLSSTSVSPCLDVTNFTGESTTLGTVTLNWTPTVTATNGYQISFRTPPITGIFGAPITVLGTGTNTFNVTGLNSNTDYEFRIRAACNNGTFSNFSATNTITVDANCPAPTITNATPTVNSITVEWTAVPLAVAGYLIQWRRPNDTWSSAAVSAATTARIIGGLAPSTIYEVRIASFCGGTSRSAFTLRSVTTDGGGSTGCTNPPAFTVVTPTINDITVAWTPLGGAMGGYEVGIRTIGGTFADVIIASAGASSHTFVNLLPNTAYEVRVRANCGSGNFSTYTTNVSTTLPPSSCPTPTNVVLTPGPNSILVSWTAATGAQGYRVEYRTGVLGTFAAVDLPATATSTNITGLASNTAYEVRVRTSCGGAIVSGYTTTQTTSTICPVPVISSIVAGPTAFTINWVTAGFAVDGYRVEYRRVGDATFTVVNAPPTPNFFTVTGLTRGVNYEVRLSTICGGGSASAATTIQNTTTNCNPPVIINSSSTETSITINWTPIPGVITGYRVEIKRAADANYTSQDVANVSTFTFTGLVAGTSYNARVSTICGAGDVSATSTVATINTGGSTPCTAPGNVVLTPGGTAVNVTWAAVTGATGYRVEWRRVGDATFTSSGDLAATPQAYVIGGLTATTNYEVRILTICAGGVVSPPSGPTPITTTDGGDPNCPTPVIASALPAEASILVSWNTVTGTNIGYRIEWKRVSDATFTGADLGSGQTSFSITGLAANTEYNIRLRTRCSATSNSAFTTLATTVRTASPGCNAPMLTSINPTETSLEVFWNLAMGTNVTGYTLEYKLASATTFTTVQLPATATRFDITNLVASSLYDVRIRSRCGATDVSPFVTTQGTTVSSSCAVPTNVSVGASATTLAVTWTGVSGSPLGYRIEYRTGTGAYTGVDVPATPTNFTITGLVPGTIYQVRIRTRCSATNQSAFVASGGITIGGPCSAPEITRITPGVNNIFVVWNPVPAAANGYTIEWRTGTGAFSSFIVPQSTNTTFNITGLFSASDYEVRIRANCSGTETSPNTTRTVTTLAPTDCPPPTIISTTTVSNTVTVSWLFAPEAGFGHAISWRVAGGEWVHVNLPQNQTRYTIQNLFLGTEYFIRLRSVCGDLTLSQWAESQINTLPPICEPPIISATSVTTNSILVNWIPAPGAIQGYMLSYRESGGNWIDVMIPAGSTSFNITDLNPGTTYFVRIASRCSAIATSAFFNSTAVTQGIPCATPTFTSVIANPTSISVNWNAVPTARGFNIRWRTGNGLWTSQDLGNVNSFLIPNLTACLDYVIELRATCTSGGSLTALRTVTTAADPNVPASVSINRAQTVVDVCGSFVLALDGTINQNYRYQWRRNGVPLTMNGELPTLTITESGRYELAISVGNCAPVVSNAVNATIKVIPALAVNVVANASSPTATDGSLVIGCVDQANRLCRDNRAGYSYRLVGTRGFDSRLGAQTFFAGLAADTYTATIMDMENGCAASTNVTLTGVVVNCETPSNLQFTAGPTSLAVNWVAIASASRGYEVGWSLDGNNYITVASLTNSFVINNLVPNTVYVVRVRALCDNNRASEFVSSATTTLSGDCMAPVISSVTPTSTSAQVVWSNEASAVGGYRIMWRNTITGESRQATTAALNPAFGITDLRPNTTYEIRVMSICGAGTSPFSPPVTILTPNICAAPTIMAISATGTSATVFWSTVIGARGYTVSYRLLNSEEPWTTFNTNAFTNNSVYSRVLFSLIPNRAYQVRVRTVCDEGFSEWSAIAEFSTTLRRVGSSAMNDNELSSDLSVYPNPTQGSIQLRLAHVPAESAEVIVLDQLGKAVLRQTVDTAQLANGALVDVSSIAAGLYTIVVQAGEIQLQSKLIRQ
jgi:hypothetical protein